MPQKKIKTLVAASIACLALNATMSANAAPKNTKNANKPTTATAAATNKSITNNDGLSAIPMDVSFSENGLNFKTKSGNFETNIYGYIQADGMKFTGDSQGLNSGANIRRARLYVFGKVVQDFGYSFSYDFANSGSLLNANISYLGVKNMDFILGQSQPNFGMSNWSDALATNFLELAPVVNAFSPNYATGAYYNYYGNTFFTALGAFGPKNDQSVTGRNPIGATARFVYSPIHTDTRVFEIGVSGYVQRPDGSNTASFSAVPDARDHSGNTLVNTGTITNVKNFNAINPEIVGVYGPFSAQAEYITTKVNRQDGQKNLRFAGYYATAGYFLTGESRLYDFKGAAFSGITPIHHSYGAWQVLARYDHLNLNDNTIRGGNENDVTLGVNWFYNQFVTLKVNYVRAMAHPASDNTDKNVNVFEARIQARF